MPKRKAPCAPGDATQGGPPPRKRAARQRAPPKPPLPLYKASVKNLAETDINRVQSSTTGIDNAIRARIQKCLDRGNHPGTPESEAKIALCMASRIMEQHNIPQAELLAHGPASTRKQYGGQSDVQLLRSDGDRSKPVRHQNYVGTLCRAMSTFFDCKNYSTGLRSSLVLTFYGIAENTVAAALSFEMVYNLICEWARPYKGIGRKNSYALGVCEELNRMAKKIKKEELEKAKNAEEESTAARLRQEEAERQAQARLQPWPLGQSDCSSPEPEAHIGDSGNKSSSHTRTQGNASGHLLLGYDHLESNYFGSGEGSQADMDDDINEDYMEPDFEVQDNDTGNSVGIGTLVCNTVSGFNPSPAANTADTSDPGLLDLNSPVHPTGVKETASASTNMEPEQENKWKSQMQLQLFRESASKIADEYLEECDIKLRSSTSRASVIRDRDSYNKGVEDSKKIDIHRERLIESANPDV